MRGLTFDDAVRGEVDDAVEWLDYRQSGLGLRFLDTLNENLTVVRENPLSSVRGDYGTRLRLLKPFHRMAVFEFDDDTVHVVAVVHESQRPGYWRSRTSWDD